MPDHISVLLNESIEALNIQPTGCYIDGTFGRGGHTRALLSKLGPTGQVLAMDRDPEAIEAGQAIDDDRLTLVHAEFNQLSENIERLGWASVDGILLDLGVSSPQLNEGNRGFSFAHDGPLDMRMDPTQGESAAEWLNRAKQADIADVLYQYGDERHSRPIAKGIATAREQSPLTHTSQFAEIIRQAHPAWPKDKHPATKSFQAIRIYINQELAQLESVLPQAMKALRPGGRLAIISFHSLEDRMVKRFMKAQAKGTDAPPEIPLTAAQIQSTLKILHRQGIRPSSEETERNPRARSAVLRVAEKLST